MTEPIIESTVEKQADDRKTDPVRARSLNDKFGELFS